MNDYKIIIVDNSRPITVSMPKILNIGQSVTITNMTEKEVIFKIEPNKDE
jgi:hypothetical protein